VAERGGQRGRGGRGGYGRRGGGSREEVDRGGFEETVVKIYRCSKVVKGGRRFSFGALVVCGDKNGQVGVGYGKANEVPPAVEKGIKDAKKALIQVPKRGRTIPHRVKAKYRASQVVLLPAPPGTGVIAGSSARAVLELAGVHDVLTKAYGSTSPKNLVKATLKALSQLKTAERIAELRQVAVQV